MVLFQSALSEPILKVDALILMLDRLALLHSCNHFYLELRISNGALQRLFGRLTLYSSFKALKKILFSFSKIDERLNIIIYSLISIYISILSNLC